MLECVTGRRPLKTSVGTSCLAFQGLISPRTVELGVVLFLALSCKTTVDKSMTVEAGRHAKIKDRRISVVLCTLWQQYPGVKSGIEPERIAEGGNEQHGSARLQSGPNYTNNPK